MAVLIESINFLTFASFFTKFQLIPGFIITGRDELERLLLLLRFYFKGKSNRGERTMLLLFLFLEIGVELFTIFSLIIWLIFYGKSKGA